MDIRSQQTLASLHPNVRDKAIGAWAEAQAAMPSNVQIIAIAGLRTFQESADIYAQGRTKPGTIVSDAQPGQSYHNYGLAFDMAMITNGKDDPVVGPLWMKVVAILKANGFEWGGDFPKQNPKFISDAPHFEIRFGYNWRALLAKYQAKDFIAGTTYVNL